MEGPKPPLRFVRLRMLACPPPPSAPPQACPSIWPPGPLEKWTLAVNAVLLRHGVQVRGTEQPNSALKQELDHACKAIAKAKRGAQKH